MLTGLLPGDLLLILNPIYVGEKTGEFKKYTKDGMLILHKRNGFNITFWYPFGAGVLLGRLHA